LSAERHPAFWERLGAAPAAAERASLDELIDQRLSEAAERWPRVVDEAPFLAHWASVLSKRGELRAQLSATHTGDLYLAYCCALGRPEAIALLQREVLPTLAPALRKVEPSVTFIEEVQQLLLDHLLVPREGQAPRLASFAGQSSLGHWLRAVALRLALNLRRSARRSPEIATELSDLDVAAPMREPQLEVLRHRFGAAFGEALRGAFGRLDPRERSLLRLHYLEGLSLGQIGASYQVNKSTVSRWMGEARDVLLTSVREELESRHGIARAEVDSLMRALDSQVELNLSSVLRSKG
jgi:RNA polymerase sigma-70 factor (ECF subfamily)